MFIKNLVLTLFFAFLLLVSAADAATYTVDRLDDANVTTCSAAANDCTLRGAINKANAAGGANTIAFSVGGGSGLPQTINILSSLPTITTSLTIDGTTQPLWGGFPLIELNGGGAGANTNGLDFTSPVGGNTITIAVKGLIINRFAGHGIAIGCTGGVTATVVDNYIGVDPGGTVNQGNGADGVLLVAYPNSTFNIGGTGTSQRNVISANGIHGIAILTATSVLPANTNLNFQNNYIGVSAAGNALGNTANGINVDQLLPGAQSSGYIVNIGGSTSSVRNVISGNTDGIAASTGNLYVYNNYIGTNANGNAAAANTSDGVQLTGNTSAYLGGTLTISNVQFPSGNLISGNTQNGINFASSSVAAVVQTNLIGTNAAGTAAIANGQRGIYLNEATNTNDASVTIGSNLTAADGNVISGNGIDGIDIASNFPAVNIWGNKIGTNSAGSAAIPNVVAGIRLESTRAAVGVAGNSSAANVISGNGSSGVMLVGAASTSNAVYTNFIGTNSFGASIGNGSDGIYINQGAANNSIGDGTAAGGNTIAFNTSRGVNVSDGMNNSIRGNSIYSNGSLGIDLNGNGVTPNDNLDTDTGPNGLQNFPVIGNASTSQLYGTLNSTPNKPFTLDFYRGDSCDASGNGEGRYYLGSKNVNVTNSGIGTFNYLDIPLTLGQIITATATDQNGSTSEFSPCYTVNPPPGNFSFTSATYSTSEAGGLKTIVVSRTGGSYGTSQVNYATTGGTATAGQDYTAQSGTLVFNNGDVVKSFDIPILDDLLDENDETINLNLSFPTNGSILVSPSSAVLTILDNDPAPTVSIDDISSPEGNQGTTQPSFRVQLSAPSGLPVTVDYATANGTATASSDYLAATGQITFQPGETIKTLPITVLGDLVPELDETFFVNLTNPVNASITKAQGVGTILDDDNQGKFAFAFAPYSGTEHQTVPVTVTRTNGSAGTVSVDYTTGGGTATPFTDYTPASGTLVFGDGETTKTFNITLADDLIPEPTETVNLMLSNPIGGAALGAPSTAVLTIFDNDSGTLLNVAGVVRRSDNTPVQNATITLQGGQAATTQTDAGGRYSFANLAPNADYTVTPSALGYTFAPLSQLLTNLTADNLSVNFTATPAPSRQLSVIGGNATPGQNVTAVVQLVAQGDENAVGFSLNYDQAILSLPTVQLNPDAAAANLFFNTSQPGKLGILLSLPANQAFTVGTRSLVTVTFATAATNAYSSPLTFGDIPVVKQVVNVNADPLPTTYVDGSVTFAQGYEADVAPRPTGNINGTVTVADYTQVGRFVAGLDTVNPNYNEFQRADCAPRISLGNGQLTVSDFTQAGRYAAGLDIVNPAGGQALAAFAAPYVDGKDTNALMVPTSVRAVSTTATPGQQVTVSFETDTVGTENGYGFTVTYDAAKLSNPLVARGTDTQSASLIPNTSQIGRVGVVLAMPFGQAIAAGTRQLVTIRFDVAANAGGTATLAYADSPVFREIVDTDAGTLSSTFQGGTITILAPTAGAVSVAGRTVTSGGAAIGGGTVTLTSAGGEVRTAIANPFGYFEFANVAAGATYTLEASHRRYSFTPRVLMVSDDLTDLEIVGQP